MEPPDLATQLEDLFSFTIKLSKENEDLVELPISAPKCENSKKPAKFGSWEDPGAIANTFKGIHRQDIFGNDVYNSRECPHCTTILFSQAAIGQIVACLGCGGTMQW